MLVLSAVALSCILGFVRAKLVSPDCVFSPPGAEGRHGDTIAFTSATDQLVRPSAGQGQPSHARGGHAPSLFEVPASGTTHPFFCAPPGSGSGNTFVFTARDSNEPNLAVMWGIGAAVAIVVVVALCSGCCYYQSRVDGRNRRAGGSGTAGQTEVEVQLPKYQARSQTGEVVLQPDLGRTPTYVAQETIPDVIVRSESPAPIAPESTIASPGRAVVPLRQGTN
ncbi:hypothetical protein AURDEDRAFT_122218 [Auricularia subglabra TFB-10046 SS5]|nr:hypothetical protein AURDEDRAFT_122218 [Auricularia subglabra TFB-10046 SS5]